MRFEPDRAFAEAEPLTGGARAAAFASDLPPETAFLRSYHVDAAALQQAAWSARQNGACAARNLITEEGVSAALYYRALASHLDVPFVDKWPRVVPPRDLAASYKAEAVFLAESASPRWLMAPTGKNLRTILAARRLGISLPDVAITTPSHMAAVIQYRAQDAVEDTASDVLNRTAPHLSAKGAANRAAGRFFSLVVLFSVIGSLVMSRYCCDAVGLLFLVGICLRFVTCLAGLTSAREHVEDLHDADLPHYTVLVPLHDEGRIVPSLIENLCAIDYPRAKIEILMLVEPEDVATREALAAIVLPPHFRVVVAPSKATLRTKPRALNIGLAMARGSLLTVYDAEDKPDPNQLRRAAALFDQSPETLACLQAKLAMGNGADGLIPELFAIEYATLFDVSNVGTAKLRLPLALGGTSNHFRVATLRAVGGWDAWNVTEDADLGLRLARFGYEVAALDSTTMEAAPMKIGVWLKQRRRWMKGWMQTFLVLARMRGVFAGSLVGRAPRSCRQCSSTWSRGRYFFRFSTSSPSGIWSSAAYPSPPAR